MKIFYLLMIHLLISSVLVGQTSLSGKVTDEETGEELIYCNLVLEKNGVFVTSASTDFEGDYLISDLEQGTYELKISYTGYPEKLISGITIQENEDALLDIKMHVGVVITSLCYSHYYVIPLLDLDQTASEKTTSSAQIRNHASKDISEIILNTPGVSIGDF